MFNTEDFIKDLNESISKMEAEELNINVTGDEESDREMIQNPQQANYFCKVVNELREERAKTEELINQELKRVQREYEAYKTKELNRIDGQIQYFSGLLESYATKELQNSKKRSIKLPHGTLSIKKQQDKYDYDEEAILECLKKNKQDKFIKVQTVETVNKKDLKKEGFSHNGKLYLDNIEVKGVVITAQPDKFEVK
jgi:hypothetical protein